ncbi:MAG: hypothetical protein H7Z40_07370 [Phycisphaerae bacterium]|nr:hypothetical protein [Gemmatimonadaceae bacterium]
MRIIQSLAVPILTSLFSDAVAQSPKRDTLPAPTATIGKAFTRVGSVRSLSDGRALVLDVGDRSLFLVDWMKGTAVQVGREGKGPAEYTNPTALIALPNDSTLIIDAGLGRWLLMHEARIVGTVTADAPALRAGARAPFAGDDAGMLYEIRGANPAQTFGGNATVSTGGPAKADSAWLLRVTRKSGRVDSIVRVQLRPSRVAMSMGSDGTSSFRVEINPLAVGEQAALAHDGTIAIARLNPYRVDWLRRGGTRLLGKPLPFERVTVSDREKLAALTRLAESQGRARKEPTAVPDWPGTMPPFLAGSVLIASDGTAWIRRTPLAGNSESTYDIISSRDQLVGRVRMKPQEVVVGFNGPHLFSVIIDDDGLQHLRRHPMPRH